MNAIAVTQRILKFPTPNITKMTLITIRFRAAIGQKLELAQIVGSKVGEEDVVQAIPIARIRMTNPKVSFSNRDLVMLSLKTS